MRCLWSSWVLPHRTNLELTYNNFRIISDRAVENFIWFNPFLSQKKWSHRGRLGDLPRISQSLTWSPDFPNLGFFLLQHTLHRESPNNLSSPNRVRGKLPIEKVSLNLAALLRHSSFRFWPQAYFALLALKSLLAMQRLSSHFYGKIEAPKP